MIRIFKIVAPRFWLMCEIVLVIAAAALLCSGCNAGGRSHTEQSGTGNSVHNDQSQAAARVDKLMAAMEANFQAVAELKAEIRAGTQEKRTTSTAGRDVTAADAQQAGFLNLSWQEATGAGGAGLLALAICAVMYSQRKYARDMKAMEERARSAEDFQETGRDWIHENARLAMAGRPLIPIDYMPKFPNPAPPCERRRWLFGRCRKAA